MNRINVKIFKDKDKVKVKVKVKVKRSVSSIKGYVFRNR